MVKDQLFKKNPSDELFNKVLYSFGLESLKDFRSFTRKDLKVLRTVEKLNLIIDDLKLCYLPCKARTYLSSLTEKNSITILRQILRTRNYGILSREKYMRGEKFIIYSLTHLEDKEYKPLLYSNVNTELKKKHNNVPILITFD